MSIPKTRIKSAIFSFLIAVFSLNGTGVFASTKKVPIEKGWAKNSVNATIFRKNSVVTHGNSQYVAYYTEDGYVNLAKRSLDSDEWEIRKTSYQGNIRDAHNGISIMVDGDGYLHMAWDHHGHPLRYCVSKTSESIEMGDKIPMTGQHEDRVTYPQFFRLPNGNLFFLFREGSSGNGDLLINYYDTAKKKWEQSPKPIVSGQGERNAYWQAHIDDKGTAHLSWVWRETGDVATNHDMCYARSRDSGKTWEKTTGEKYELPITAEDAEYAAYISQKHELINQTSMSADAEGNPYIATYFRRPGTEVPQYAIIYHDGDEWITEQVTDRKLAFSLSGGGSKRIPISRPQLAVKSSNETTSAYMLFRDEERGWKASVAHCPNLKKHEWRIEDITESSVGLWEPTYDTELWREHNRMHIFLQKVGQGDGETTEDIPAQMISILEWTPPSD